MRDLPLLVLFLAIQLYGCAVEQPLSPSERDLQWRQERMARSSELADWWFSK